MSTSPIRLKPPSALSRPAKPGRSARPAAAGRRPERLAAATAASSSLARTFAILDLFTLETPVIEVDDVVKGLGYTRSTAYRYLKELCAAGLLRPTVQAGQYALGARIVELERLLELTDPLYRAGRDILEKVRSHEGSLLLQSLNQNNQVLCIYKKGPDVLEHAGAQVALTRSRGVPFPLFRGAASLVILACLSSHRIRQTYLADAQQIAEAGLGQDWEEFRARMAAIRKRGYAVSRTEGKRPLVVGIAVPIHLPAPDQKRVIGSIVQVCAGDQSPTQEATAVKRLMAAAQQIAQQYLSFSQVPSSHRSNGARASTASPFKDWQLIS
ncbi:MAG TPA: helix-turn-helix domain-containing protein [Ramlibacter sp.]|nr:helix-turn-helix domain-containing protein [Ramlibacter sp.]